MNDFERWFDNPPFLYMDIDVSKFETRERQKLVEMVVQNEAKGGKKGFKDVNSVNMLCSDFFGGAGHIAIDFDKGFKEGSDVAFEVAAEHLNNLSIVLNSRPTNGVKVAETIHNVIDILTVVNKCPLFIYIVWTMMQVTNTESRYYPENCKSDLEENSEDST